MPADLKSILSLEVPLIVVIGSRDMPVKEVMNLAPGAIIELPKLANEELEILVNNKKVVILQNGKIPPTDIQQGAAYPVYQELVELAKVNKAAAEQLRGNADDGTKKAKPGEITIEMDKRHDFELLRRIMLAGQQAEFITFKLLVAKEHI